MEFCLMPQYTVHLQIGGIEIRTHNTHPLRTMILNYVFPGLAYFFFFQYWPIFLYQCKCSDLDLLMSEIILILEIMSATFFLSSSFLPINYFPFTYICSWNQTDKYLSNSNFALAFNLPQVPLIDSWLFTWWVIQQFLHVMDLAIWWSSKAY